MEREEKLGLKLKEQKRILNKSQKLQKQGARHAVPAKFWGHQTVAWARWSRPGYVRPTPTSTRASPPTRPPKPPKSAKLYSIPLPPIRPPSKLPPLASYATSPPTKCGSVFCDQEPATPDTDKEVFANNLEAVLSHIETEGATWEEHPYYEEDSTDDDVDPVDDPEEVAWEDHPYYSSADDQQDLAYY